MTEVGDELTFCDGHKNRGLCLYLHILIPKCVKKIRQYLIISPLRQP